MTPEQLKALADGVLEAGLKRVTLTVPREWRRAPGWPLPELLSINPDDGSKNLSFDARQLSDFLARRGIK